MAAPTFFVKSQNSDFLNKQKGISSLLADAEKTVDLEKNNIPAKTIKPGEMSQKRSQRAYKQYRGQESLFKKPLPVVFKARNIPDYQRNPERWTKYSLGDVSAEDMSESSTKAAAFEFLNSLKERKAPKEEEDNEAGPIIFKKRPRKVGFGDESNPVEVDPPPQKAHFKSSVLVMPEYEVGAKIKRPKKDRRHYIRNRSETPDSC